MDRVWSVVRENARGAAVPDTRPWAATAPAAAAPAAAPAQPRRYWPCSWRRRRNKEGRESAVGGRESAGGWECPAERVDLVSRLGSAVWLSAPRQHRISPYLRRLTAAHSA